MIHFDPQTKIFNLLLKKSIYAFYIDEDDCPVHLTWVPRPEGASDDLLLQQSQRYENRRLISGFERQTVRYEQIAFGDVSYHEVSLKVAFPNGDQMPIRDVRLRYVGHEIVSDAQPGLAPQHGLTITISEARQTLRLFLQDPVQPFRVNLCYRLTPELDILERWCELENSGTEVVTVEACSFATLHVPNGTNELTSVSGTHNREFTTQRQALPIGLRILESRTVTTSHFSNPFVLLNRPHQAWEEHGIVYFAALAYSGAWRIAIDHLPTLEVRVHAGYNPFDFELKLGAQERHVTPALVCGVSGEGWGGASRRLHSFALQRVLPRPQRESEFRPVLYNSWEATYFDLSVAGQSELARKAAAIGVELFCLDDGWFGARRNDLAGLGDWRVSPDVFPDGLQPLIEEVHRLGMKFGLWFEPEMVNPDSELYRQYPDWVLHFPDRPRTTARNQLVLDFGRPEVVEYIFSAMDQLLSEVSIDFIKWDMNRNVSEPGSVVGKAIWVKHVEGVYSIMDRLRAQYPGLDIQSCSGGGGRIDLGILARTDQVWTSDNTDALDRIRIQEGYSLAYPARAMEAWVTHAHNHQTGRTSSLDFRFDVAMRGTLGVGSSLNQLDESELAAYASHIAFYKRIRHVVQEGDLYRLQRLEEFGASVIEYVLADGSEAVYSIAVSEHQYSIFRPLSPLKGLKHRSNYVVLNRHNEEVHRATGYELMTLGIPGDANLGAGVSRTLYVKEKETSYDSI